MHAHLAALMDDDDAYRAFVDEIEEIAETIVLKLGGLEDGVPPIEVGEILRPFYVGDDGDLVALDGLLSHPAEILLLDEAVIEAAGLDVDRPIEEALQWAEEHRNSTAARSIEQAWMTYRTEQNLMATYGFGVRRPAPGPEEIGVCFARRSAVLPNMRTLFDPRFLQCRLSELDLSGPAGGRLERGLGDDGCDLGSTRLGDIDRDERDLARLHGVSHKTCNEVRRALLKLGTHWRWRRCGRSR